MGHCMTLILVSASVLGHGCMGCGYTVIQPRILVSASQDTGQDTSWLGVWGVGVQPRVWVYSLGCGYTA